MKDSNIALLMLLFIVPQGLDTPINDDSSAIRIIQVPQMYFQLYASVLKLVGDLLRRAYFRKIGGDLHFTITSLSRHPSVRITFLRCGSQDACLSYSLT